VRAALQEMTGVGQVQYDPDRDLFTVDYEADRTDLAAIFAAVFQAGKKMGQNYFPKLVT
jgi:hypothetical protein